MTVLVKKFVLTLHFILFREKADFILPNNMINHYFCHRDTKAIYMNHIENIKTLLSKINPIYAKAKQADEEKRKRGEYSNVFNTLGLWSEEVRLHSSFLAELLNPNGNHGMGNAFLCQFLQLIKEQPDYIQSDKVNQEIVERYIGQKTDNEGGRLDIIIEDGNHAVIIENKIYAPDQKHQLFRYDNYGKTHFPTSGGYRLIYLTLDGHEASDVSTGNQPLDYICLSYSRHILAWLYKCVQLAYDKPLVRETIKQYIHLIKQLTNQDMETEDKKAIAELAVNNLEATAALMESCAEISTLLREQYIIRPLREFAEENNYNFDTEHDGCVRFKPSSWKRHRISVTSDKTNWQSLYIGIDSGEEEPLQKKLDCLNLPPNAYWAFGSEWLPADYGNWISSSNFLAIKSGKVADWIKEKVQAILREVDEKGIRM